MYVVIHNRFVYLLGVFINSYENKAKTFVLINEKEVKESIIEHFVDMWKCINFN